LSKNQVILWEIDFVLDIIDINCFTKWGYNFSMAD